MERPDRQQVRYKRLWAAYESDRPALAVALARRYLDVDPADGTAWLVLGDLLTGMALYDEAEVALETALRLCPPDKRRVPLAEIGHHHKARGDYERAGHWYREAIEADPDNAGGYIDLGVVLALSGRLDEAERAHRTATRCPDGRVGEAYHNLGLILRAQGRLEEAALCFACVLELDLDDRAARRALRDVRATLALRRKRARPG